jgi:hypothetical protein
MKFQDCTNNLRVHAHRVCDKANAFEAGACHATADFYASWVSGSKGFEVFQRSTAQAFGTCPEARPTNFCTRSHRSDGTPCKCVGYFCDWCECGWVQFGDLGTGSN